MPFDAPILKAGRLQPELAQPMPVPAPLHDRLARARVLASEIEQLLDGGDNGDHAFSLRLAKAMTRNLVDQLAEIERPPTSSSRLPLSKIA